MRYFITVVILAIKISGCSYTPSESSIQTAIAQTQAAKPAETLPIESNEPTEALTPTIAPTPVRIGLDNLPLEFEGVMQQCYWDAPCLMIFYIEERSGDRVSGKTRFPDKIYGWEGDIVHDFGDIPEENYWAKLEAYGSEGGTWIKTTTRRAIGAHPDTDGNYYLFISDTGKVTGNWFRWNQVEPGPSFILHINEDFNFYDELR